METIYIVYGIGKNGSSTISHSLKDLYKPHIVNNVKILSYESLINNIYHLHNLNTLKNFFKYSITNNVKIFVFFPIRMDINSQIISNYNQFKKIEQRFDKFILSNNLCKSNESFKFKTFLNSSNSFLSYYIRYHQQLLDFLNIKSINFNTINNDDNVKYIFIKTEQINNLKEIFTKNNIKIEFKPKIKNKSSNKNKELYNKVLNNINFKTKVDKIKNYIKTIENKNIYISLGPSCHPAGNLKSLNLRKE